MPISKIIYYSIVYPYLNYCCIVWSSANISFLQSFCSTQRKLIRLICKKDRRSNSSILFKHLKFLKLEDVLKLNCSLFVYKSINNIIESDIVFTERRIEAYNLRAWPQLQVPNHTSKQSERFIHIRGAKIWNELPDNIRNSISTASFKRSFKIYFLDAFI